LLLQKSSRRNWPGRGLGPILLGADIGFEHVRHSFEVGDHAFDLNGTLVRAFDAELPQAIEPLANSAVGSSFLPCSPSGCARAGNA